ncbi:MAG: MGH1-like glycoside hydrolase domain-containing protein, partial [Thermocrispum sp.]
MSEPALAAAAGRVLSRNDTGRMITASPLLYPHMWSWDAAFITVGLAHLSVERAGRELATLFAAQWSDGMVPHIVFSEAEGYFPGPRRWGAHELSPHAPAEPKTSGICQPPVHAIA